MSYKPTDKLSICFTGAEAQVSAEDRKTVYVKVEEHLRLIFRDGEYAGFYDPALESVI
jgi:hypothetical protein